MSHAHLTAPDGLTCDLHGKMLISCGYGAKFWSSGGIFVRRLNFCFEWETDWVVVRGFFVQRTIYQAYPQRAPEEMKVGAGVQDVFEQPFVADTNRNSETLGYCTFFPPFPRHDIGVCHLAFARQITSIDCGCISSSEKRTTSYTDRVSRQHLKCRYSRDVVVLLLGAQLWQTSVEVDLQALETRSSSSPP